jgi:hypothetical protein
MGQSLIKRYRPAIFLLGLTLLWLALWPEAVWAVVWGVVDWVTVRLRGRGWPALW